MCDLIKLLNYFGHQLLLNDFEFTNYFGHQILLYSKVLHLQFIKYLELALLQLFWTSIININA